MPVPGLKVQHFDAQNSKGTSKKKKKYSVYNFSEHKQHNKIFGKMNELNVNNY